MKPRPPLPSVTICENSQRTISCPRNMVIRIRSANYGRLNGKTCPSKLIKTTNCRSKKSLSVVIKSCNGKRSCRLIAKNNVFGDPCVGTFKYLRVDYLCQGM